MAYRSIEIKKFENLIQIGTRFRMNWYRGHSDEYTQLTPKIHRPHFWNEIIKAFIEEPEMRHYFEFMRRAPSISQNLPEPKDYAAWLFIMQHHGLPTRLLDWTENILVAAFFACRNEPKKNGEIWSMLPWKLNAELGFYGLPLADAPLLRFFASEVFHNNPKKLAEELKIKIPSSPMAILPVQTFRRIAAQQGCFTIHLKPDSTRTIQEVITEENCLVRYVIPAKYKSDFLQDLETLGITYSTLFPDLDGLAKAIVKRNQIIGWGQPDLEDFQ